MNQINMMGRQRALDAINRKYSQPDMGRFTNPGAGMAAPNGGIKVSGPGGLGMMPEDAGGGGTRMTMPSQMSRPAGNPALDPSGSLRLGRRF